MINGYRVRLARELSCLTQSDMADEIGVTQSAIAQIESGRFQPSVDVVDALSARLGFPATFFSLDDPPHFPSGSLLFRAHANLSSSEKAEAERYGQIVYEASITLGKRVKNKTPLRLPQLDEEPTDIVTAAQLTRDALSMSPDMPIPHLIRAVEQIGVLVFAIPVHLPKREAYSLWSRVKTLWSSSELMRPVIVVFAGVPGDRLRFSVAHELGHLVMHQAIRGVSHELEKDADKFAVELLMPSEAMTQEILAPVTINSLASLKARWGVSIKSLLRRAKELDVISDRQYRYLRERMAQYGWERQEPYELVSEKPRALRQMAEMIYGQPIDYQRLASELRLTPHFTKRIIEAYATKEESFTRISMREENTSDPIGINRWQ